MLQSNQLLFERAMSNYLKGPRSYIKEEHVLRAALKVGGGLKLQDNPLSDNFATPCCLSWLYTMVDPWPILERCEVSNSWDYVISLMLGPRMAKYGLTKSCVMRTWGEIVEESVKHPPQFQSYVVPLSNQFLSLGCTTRHLQSFQKVGKIHKIEKTDLPFLQAEDHKLLRFLLKHVCPMTDRDVKSWGDLYFCSKATKDCGRVILDTMVERGFIDDAKSLLFKAGGIQSELFEEGLPKLLPSDQADVVAHIMTSGLDLKGPLGNVDEYLLKSGFEAIAKFSSSPVKQLKAAAYCYTRGVLEADTLDELIAKSEAMPMLAERNQQIIELAKKNRIACIIPKSRHLEADVTLS